MARGGTAARANMWEAWLTARVAERVEGRDDALANLARVHHTGVHRQLVSKLRGHALACRVASKRTGGASSGGERRVAAAACARARRAVLGRRGDMAARSSVHRAVHSGPTHRSVRRNTRCAFLGKADQALQL